MLSELLDFDLGSYLRGNMYAREENGNECYLDLTYRVVHDWGPEVRESYVAHVEYERACRYYQELNTPFGPQQRDHPTAGLSTLRTG
jgi:hypothetical protein